MSDPAGDDRSPRWPWWKVVIVILTVLTAPATIPCVLLWAFFTYHGILVHRFYARTPFVADLSGPTIQDQQRQFAERAQGAFPIGMPVQDLERALMSQGFSPSPFHHADEDRLHVEYGIFPCLMGWDVFWTARDGKVADTHGVMTATCL